LSFFINCVRLATVVETKSFDREEVTVLEDSLAARHIGARERAGLTQLQEAREAGVSATTISGIESGKIDRPHYRTILRLSEALGVHPDELLGKVGAPA
jgi:DNA-binding XRE family transcriptional regulator